MGTGGRAHSHARSHEGARAGAGAPVLSNSSNLHLNHQKSKKTEIPPPPPVVGVDVYPNDVQIIRAAQKGRNGGGERMAITEISWDSIKNAKFVIANSEPELMSLIAVTYPETFPTDGRVVKEHHRRLLYMIGREYGAGFSYFTAIEYQKRGAPHFHTAISFDLRDFGPITEHTRQDGRRGPDFATHKPSQDWLFESWLEIIAKPDPKAGGEVLAWGGVSDVDEGKMRAAYYNHNAGVAWECMRDANGAKKYMVKELSGLKQYQKIVPPDFAHPGRHFLYSRDMRPRPVASYKITGREVRAILKAVGWPFLPPDNEPLPKTLWNVARDVAAFLAERGIEPVEGLRGLRLFDDLRAWARVDMETEEMMWAKWGAETRRVMDEIKEWERTKRRMIDKADWDYIMSQEEL